MMSPFQTEFIDFGRWKFVTVSQLIISNFQFICANILNELVETVRTGVRQIQTLIEDVFDVYFLRGLIIAGIVSFDEGFNNQLNSNFINIFYVFGVSISQCSFYRFQEW